MFKIRRAYFIVLLFWGFIFNGQNANKIAELKKEIEIAKDDTTKVKKLLKLSAKLNTSEFASSISYANEALELAKRINYIKGQSRAYNCLADAYWFHSDYDKAQQYYFKSYRINDSIHDKKAIAYSLYNIGWIICIQQHNFEDSKYLYQALQIYQDLKDTTGLSQIYNGLANYFSERWKVEHIKKYCDSSMAYYNKGIDLAKAGNLYSDMGRLYSNIGDLLFSMKDYKNAVIYNNKSLKIHKDVSDSSSISISMLNLSLCDIELGNYAEAILKLNEVYRYNERHDVKDVQLGTIKALADCYYKMGKFKESHEYLLKYSILKEALDKEAFSTSINNMQSSYSLEKAEANVAQLKQTNEIQELKNRKNQYFIFTLLGIALVVIAVAFLLFRQNKEKQLTNIQLKEQNNIIAEKKQEIDNSIQYAKGIQLAVLPDVKELKNHLHQSFVFYKPKDVVSGDFYWFSKVNEDFYCIAADCTGHGVPGALMSIIGVDKIVQAIFEKRVYSPGGILSFLNQQVKHVLKQHSDESKQKDGMDLALLKFNPSLMQVEFSGANRPLYLIRNNDLIEYKADKTAIAGFTSMEQEFNTTSIQLQKNDCLYIFTDGYADQFGGSDGKKMMTKNLKQMLISIAGLPADLQYQEVVKTFADWKGSYEQVDDVLMIGIKI